MCKAFSCIVIRDKKVIWEAGKDSHEDLISKGKLQDNTNDPDKMKFARAEIVPDNKEKYPYLYPEKPWKFQVDERITPTWLNEEHEKLAWGAFNQWKAQVYTFNYQGARKPFNPLTKLHKPTDVDIANLKKWDSVRASVRDLVGASVRDSVWDSVGDSVWTSVWDSVWAYCGSFFPNIQEWKYIKHKKGTYPFQPCVDLWLAGFVPSFDGSVWRLHSGKKAKVVYEWNPKE